jgi:hypothetical protein
VKPVWLSDSPLVALPNCKCQDNRTPHQARCSSLSTLLGIVEQSRQRMDTVLPSLQHP